MEIGNCSELECQAKSTLVEKIARLASKITSLLQATSILTGCGLDEIAQKFPVLKAVAPAHGRNLSVPRSIQQRGSIIPGYLGRC
jgi:hypothetical protein